MPSPACRYQAWGPNTEEQTRDFVQGAVDARLRSPQTRFVYAACLDGELVGIGELKVRSLAHLQGEISYLVHPGCGVEAWAQPSAGNFSAEGSGS